jgi:hypothetical protein
VSDELRAGLRDAAMIAGIGLPLVACLVFALYVILPPGSFALLVAVPLFGMTLLMPAQVRAIWEK